ncbi:MAG: 16S rRNA (cytosine(967)-C(5))-methyltransferase RsmB [Clostridia bacterium]|jgi:16S rRNA (cytosine967-C5)-methyltransferase|nr:16S rRNA (cytosine(967)-C(5))-methyltransferase RsmB [Clostridia bacterium]
MNSRKIAVEILNMVLYEGAYSNIIIRKLLNKYNVKEKDRSLITEIVYGTLKYKYKLDVILSNLINRPFKKVDKKVLNILRISIYQFIYLDKVPEYAIVNEAVNLAKEISIASSKFVNGVLRAYLRNKDKNFNKEKGIVSELAYEYSFDKWMVKLFVNQYGIERAKEILYGLNSIPSITVRINSLHWEINDVYQRLKTLNHNVEKGVVCPTSIKIIKGSNVENNPLFSEGAITVQDESAMLAVLALEVKKNQKLLDMCAAPGGKTTHMAELLQGSGSVLAWDLYKHKIDLILDNAKRLGIPNIHADVSDATVFNDKFQESFDSVLVDVPCSGLGIIRKKPEIKWTKTQKDMEALYHIQDRILENACKYVKRGGCVVYSTCTLNVMENEKRIYKFLKKNKEFEIEKLNFAEQTNFLYNDSGMLTILPSPDMDGFFIAKLRRKI